METITRTYANGTTEMETFYTFAELPESPESIRADAIAEFVNSAAWQLRYAPDVEMYADGFDTDYYAELLEKIGAKFSTRAAKTYGVSIHNWPIVERDNGAEGIVEFAADITDVRQFMRSRKCAAKLRTLYSVADDVSVSVDGTNARRGFRVEIDDSYVYYTDRTEAWETRCTNQLRDLERIVETWYDEFCNAWAENLRADYAYREGAEYLADVLKEDETAYFQIDGIRVSVRKKYRDM